MTDLKSPDARDRIQAAEQIHRLRFSGDRAHAEEWRSNVRAGLKSSLPALVLALDDPEEQVRRHILMALPMLETKPELVVPKVRKILNDESSSPSLRTTATLTLSSFGPAAASAVPKLLEILRAQDSDPTLRAAVLQSLYKFGPAARAAVPDILRLLHAKEPGVRAGAIRAIVKLGNDQPGVIDVLLKGLEDQDGVIRNASAYAIGQIGKEPGRSVPALIDALRRQNSSDKKSSFEMEGLILSLARFGPEAVDAAPLLYEIANDPAQAERLSHSTIYALWQMGPRGKEQVRRLASKDAPFMTAITASGYLRNSKESEKGKR